MMRSAANIRPKELGVVQTTLIYESATLSQQCSRPRDPSRRKLISERKSGTDGNSRLSTALPSGQSDLRSV
jgi:hypothetical protein